jgi:uncharacterized protein (DUF1778 family)
MSQTQTSHYTGFLNVRLKPDEESLYREAAALNGLKFSTWAKQALTAEAHRLMRAKALKKRKQNPRIFVSNQL